MPRRPGCERDHVSAVDHRAQHVAWAAPRYDRACDHTRYDAMIWGLATSALLAFLLAFASHSPGWMGLGIVAGSACAIAAALVFIDRHVRASSRPEHMTDREVEALRGTLRKPDAAHRQLPPSDAR
jgi:hypothetical protein